MIEFTDDLCPGWDTAMQVDSPDISPAPEFHLSFQQPVYCTANGGFCDPDARVRQFVVDSFGVPVAADSIYCLGGASSGTTYSWGYADLATAALGYESTVAAAPDTIPIRDNFVGSLHLNESPPASGTALYSYGVTAGFEFTAACGAGSWDTAFAVSSDNDPIAIAVAPTGGGGAYVTIPLFGSVTFNPDITKASGLFLEFPFPGPAPAPAPAIGGVLSLVLGGAMAALGLHRLRRGGTRSAR